MELTKQGLKDYLLFDTPIHYNENITLYPLKMMNILKFNQYQHAFTVRKDAIFMEKTFIKMTYLDFLKYASQDVEISIKYKMPLLPYYFDMACRLLLLMCGEDSHIEIDEDLTIHLNDCEITSNIFDDLRRIFIIQNDVDFDMDEFMNIEALNALEKARDFEAKKNKSNGDTEDYIDSLAIALSVPSDYIENLTIRKFWRYVKRIQKHETYEACLTGQMGGMVTFKEPLQHWMTSMEVTDKYANVKANEDELRSKIG